MKKDTLLQRAESLEISLSRRMVTISGCEQPARLSDQALAVLDMFATPKTLEDGLTELSKRVQGRWDWLELAGNARVLVQAGALRPVDGAKVTIATHPGRFDAADIHIRMLEDAPRTLAFRDALHRCVQPGDIVLDVGTGTGVLAALAAQAGAAHVYAVERSPNTAKLAREFFAANGFADRITVIEGDSTRITLPRKAHVMVSEIVGNDPLDEGIIRTTSDAISRLLEPNPRLIPGRLRIFALPLQVPAKTRNRHFFTAGHVDRWREAYGLDFGVYRDASRQHAGDTVLSTVMTREWPRFCEPVLMSDIDLYTAQTDVQSSTHSFRAERTGMLGGVLLFFELDMGNGLTFSIHPDIAQKSNHWASKLWLSPEEIPLAEGDVWQLDYRFDRKAFSQFEFTKTSGST